MIPSGSCLPCFPEHSINAPDLALLWRQFPRFITSSALLTRRRSLGKQWRFSRSLDFKTKRNLPPDSFSFHNLFPNLPPSVCPPETATSPGRTEI